MLYAIACISKNGVVVNDKNEIPEVIPEHCELISELTRENIVIMSSKTFASLGARPMKDRLTGIITRKAKNPRIKNVRYFKSTQAAIRYYSSSEYKGKDIYILGGTSLFHDVISSVDELYLTTVEILDKGKKFPNELEYSDMKLVDYHSGTYNNLKYTMKELYRD